MKDEEDDTSVINEGESQDESNESNDEGFEDIVTSEGKHYDNHEGENDTITKVTGMYKDWFLDYASCNSRTCGSCD
jgi:topoisomerase-4 subunit A